MIIHSFSPGPGILEADGTLSKAVNSPEVNRFNVAERGVIVSQGGKDPQYLTRCLLVGSRTMLTWAKSIPRGLQDTDGPGPPWPTRTLVCKVVLRT